MSKKRIVCEGTRFGELIIIKELNKINDIRTFLCLCNCGNYKTTYLHSLVKGKVKSCGCLRKLRNHGLCQAGAYKSWSHMKERCSNPRCKSYPDYGGRGINFCNEWNDFKNFYKWAQENGYRRGLTIERKDVNGNYCPENCTWIPKGDQNKNKRNTYKVEFGGQIKTISQWAEIYGVSYEKMRLRFKTTGSIEVINSGIK